MKSNKKIKTGQLDSFNKGGYNANTNTPSLSNGIGQIGEYYIVSVAGTRNFGAGNIVLAVGDRVEYNGTTYFKVTQVTYTPENIANLAQTLVGATSTTYPSTLAITTAGYGDMTTTTGQTVSGLKVFLNGTLGMRNVANTFTSFFLNTNVASRTYTLQDRNGTLADLTDIAGRMAVPSGTINTIPKFLTATTIGNSRIFDTGTFLGIGTVNTPMKDISLGSSGEKNIGIEDSDSLNAGRTLTLTAGRTINFLINSVFTAVDSNFYSGSGAASAPNGDIYFQGFQAGLYKLTLGTNTITSVPGMGAYYGGISIGYDNSIYQTPYNGGVLTRDGSIVSGTSAYTTLGILSSKLSNKLYASFNGNIQYSTNNGVTFSVIQAGSIGIGKMCEDSFGSVYALISGFLWKQNLGTGLFVNTTIPLAGTYIAIDTNNNIYSVDQNSLYKLSFGSSVYSLFKDISTLGKGNGLAGIAIDTNNRIFLCCGINGTSQQWQLLTDAAGTADLDGGTLKLKSGTGKGTGESRIQLITGGITASGTNMQNEAVRMEINEQGLVSIFNINGTDSDIIFRTVNDIGATTSSISGGGAITGLSFNGYTPGDMTTTTGQTVSGIKTFLNGTLGIRNVANTFTSFLNNTNTASRTYTLPNKNMTVAGTDDVATKMDIPSGGVVNFLTKFLTTTTIGNSRLFDTGTYFGIETSNTPTKDLTLGNQINREIGIEDSNNTTIGRDLTINAGRTINFVLNTNFIALGQSILPYFGIAVAPNGNVYASVNGGDIYMQTGGVGNFNPLGQTARTWRGMAAAPNGNVYAVDEGGDIYMQTGGTGNFNALSQTARLWASIAVAPNGNVYASVNGGDIYMQTGGTGNFNALGQASRSYFGMATAPNGNVYVSNGSGDIYMQTGGVGNFNPLSQTARTWRGMAAAPNGNVYAVVTSGDIYMQTGGTGNFIALSQTSRTWYGIAVAPNGNAYTSVGNGDIYMQTNFAAGTADLDGGTLKLKSGTGKGTGQSRLQLITGGVTASGTNMQTEKVRIEIDENGTTNFYNNDGVITNYINAGGTHSFSNDIVLTKYFTTGSIIYSDGNWHSFNYPTSFFQANFDNSISYGSGASPVGTPSIVIPNLNHIPGKRLNKFTWNTDYCDSADAYISIVKYDVVSGNLVNGREILNQQIRILTSGTNTQGAFPYSKNSIQFTTSDIVDTPGGAQCSIYFVFLKIDSSGGGGLGTSNIYFNFN